MTRIAVVGDIHGNLPALEALIAYHVFSVTPKLATREVSAEVYEHD